MLTSQKLKQFAVEKVHVDALGVANVERFKDAPPDMNPLTVMPSCRSVVVIIKRILRGSYRGIDEGTHWPSYSTFCYAGLNGMLDRATYKIARFIEKHGVEAMSGLAGASLREWGGPRATPDKPMRQVTIQLRIAAVLAGLGEIGWSKVFMTREFGPRQRIKILLTDAELEPDPIKIGKLCDKCKRCVVECPGGAIPKTKAVSIEVEGKKIEWADIDLGKCKLTHMGLNRKTAPFLVKRYPGFYLPVGQQEVTWKEAWDLGWAICPSVPTYSALSQFGHIGAFCGARGCIIGCMKHLEKLGKLDNKFHTKPVFSEEKPWSLPEKPPHVDHHGFIYNLENPETASTSGPGGNRRWY